jgi:hypothetical protein
MKLVVILLLLVLTSCGQQKDPREALKETQGSPPSGQPSKSVYIQTKESGDSKCIDGASYELKYGGAFLQFKDGKYVTC